MYGKMGRKNSFFMYCLFMGILISIQNADSSPWAKYDSLNSPLKSGAEIAIDKKGNKWINGGFYVFKFDGTTWTRFSHETDSVIPVSCLNILLSDKNDNVWLGCACPNDDSIYREGLFRFDNNKWEKTAIGNPQDKSMNAVYFMTFDHKNEPWIIGDYRIVYHSADAWETFPGKKASFELIAIDRRDIKWINLYPERIITFNDTTIDTVNIGGQNGKGEILAIDSNDAKWIASATGIWKYSQSQWTFFDSTVIKLPSMGHLICAVDGKNRKWFGSDNGRFACFNDTGWVLFDSTNSLLKSNEHINSIAFDGDGSVWIGTRTGLLVYKETALPVKTGKKNTDNRPKGMKSRKFLFNGKSSIFQAEMSRQARGDKTTIRIFSINGTLIKSITSRKNSSEDYLKRWDGKDCRGLSVRRGVYFYSLSEN
jgi:ligand-binding sensor domain-containing protein